MGLSLRRVTGPSGRQSPELQKKSRPSSGRLVDLEWLLLFLVLPLDVRLFFIFVFRTLIRRLTLRALLALFTVLVLLTLLAPC